MIPDADYAEWDDDDLAPFCEGCGEQCDPCDLDHRNFCPDCQDEDPEEDDD